MAETNKKIKVDFVVKSDEFNRNLTETKQSIKQTTAELQTASAKLNAYGTNIQNLTGKQKLLETQIVNVNGKMKLYQENIDKNN
jgi:peptidoglycan hydrolase CwlO-like protein